MRGWRNHSRVPAEVCTCHTYLDATNGSASRPGRQYKIWAETVRNALDFVESSAGIPPGRVAIVGYSLGASVALCAAAVEPNLAGVVDWSGSLPDRCRDIRRLPPLLMIHGARDSVIPPYNVRQLAMLCELQGFSCETRISPEQHHRFSAGGLARAGHDVEAFFGSYAWFPIAGRERAQARER